MEFLTNMKFSLISGHVLSAGVNICIFSLMIHLCSTVITYLPPKVIPFQY